MRINKIYRAMMRNQVRATIAVAIIGSAIIGCTAINRVTSSDYDSYAIYCIEYGIDANDITDEQYNYYLDCFAGSAEADSLSIVYNGSITNY